MITVRKFKSNTFGGILLSLLLASAIIVLLSLLYFYAYLPNVTNHGETITVPNIEGKNILEIKDFLAKHDLRYEINDSSYSEQYPPLTVLKQYPRAGSKVKENRKIYVSINRLNPPSMPLPNLIDGSLINAEAILKGSELKRGRIELRSSPFLNLVLDMKYKGHSIAAGVRIPKGAVIDLVVGDGGSKGEYSLPSVKGLSVEDAKFLILGYNLNIGEINLVGDTLGVGPVILKQKPEAGENIRVGDIVDLWVGKPGTPVEEENDQEGQ